MTKMEEEVMSGTETKAVVPASALTKKGRGDSGFAPQPPSVMKMEPEASMVCSGCDLRILDKYFMKVDEQSWHETCISCANCHRALADSCFSKNSKLYCKKCYKQLQYCYRCSGSISGEELVMRVGADSYHVICFVCDYCSHKLQQGDQFHSLQDSAKRKICCKKCYELDDVSNLRVTASDSDESTIDSEVLTPNASSHAFVPSLGNAYSRQHSDYYPGPPPTHIQGGRVPCGKNGKCPSSTSLMTSSDSKRAKRPRTILTTAQRRKFKASFEISQKPCRKVRETLANETGLTPRVVQVWFQNQRAKMKKMARRQNQGEDGTRRKRKKDADSDSDNEVASSPGSYTSAPTPHQNQYYGEYQSPRSVQSTLSQDDGAQRVFSPSYPQHGFNHMEIQYEEYGSLSHPGISDPTFTHPQPPHSPSQLEMHQMLHEQIGGMEHTPHHNMVPRQDGSSMIFHAETMQSTLGPQRQEVMDISNERPMGCVPSTEVINPIDSLMYMQSNFF